MQASSQPYTYNTPDVSKVLLKELEHDYRVSLSLKITFASIMETHEDHSFSNKSRSGLMVKSNVAIVGLRVRFSAATLPFAFPGTYYIAFLVCIAPEVHGALILTNFDLFSALSRSGGSSSLPGLPGGFL